MAKKKKKTAAAETTATDSVVAALQAAFAADVANLFKVYAFALREAEGNADEIAAAGTRFKRGLSTARQALKDCIKLSSQ